MGESAMTAVVEQVRDWRERFDRDGYAILDRITSPDRVAELIEALQIYATGGHDGLLDRRGEVYGGRDLLWRIEDVRRLAQSRELSSIAEAILGQGVVPVRGLFFDKTPTANWNLPWHQDLTIAVRARCEVPGFGRWTFKGGIPHVHAPAELLARMVTIRLHLDDCGPESGPLRVLPGSHASAKLDPGAIAVWASRADALAVDCVVPAGGAVIMRPLILHASATGTGPGHRRVIHLEYAAEDLPGRLEWYQPERPCKSGFPA
jgi:ectoine hydroxylase-related dioxygenase (phytanoyl-CoA dioxygenase family)